MNKFVAAFALVMVLATANLAVADDALAFDTAIVFANGPQFPPLGKQYLDVGGRGNSGLTCFGVADFNSQDLNLGTVTRVGSMTVTLTQSEFSPVHDGRLIFFITTDTTTSIQPDQMNPAVVFDPADVHGLNGQLAPLFFLGSYDFTVEMTGSVDVYAFNLFDIDDHDLEAYLISEINAGGVIRVIICPEADDVGAELVGSGNFGRDAGAAVAPRLTAIAGH
jgi:hypothetical protein